MGLDRSPFAPTLVDTVNREDTMPSNDDRHDDNELPAGQAHDADLAAGSDHAPSADAPDDDPEHIDSGDTDEVDGAGNPGDTGNTGGTGGAHGASSDRRGSAGVTVGNGGGPTEQTLRGDPPARQTSDLIGTGGTLDDRPSSGTGHTSVHGGGVDDDAASIGQAADRGIPGARKS